MMSRGEDKKDFFGGGWVARSVRRSGSGAPLPAVGVSIPRCSVTHYLRTNPRSKLGASGGWSLAHVIIMLSRGPGFSMKRCFSPCATISCCASCRLPTCGVLRGNGARASGRATWASCRPCGDREVSRRPQSCPTRLVRQAVRPAAAPKRAALAIPGRVRRVGPSALRAVLGLAAVRRASAPAARSSRSVFFVLRRTHSPSLDFT